MKREEEDKCGGERTRVDESGEERRGEEMREEKRRGRTGE